MAVCIDAQFFCARRVAPAFKKQRHGAIVNLVSAAGILGYPTRSPYAAAKWAVTGFTKTLAMELGPHNIRVNGIVPGNVNGDRMERIIAAHAATDGLDPEVVRDMYAIGTSMQCYVDPEEIAVGSELGASSASPHASGATMDTTVRRKRHITHVTFVRRPWFRKGTPGGGLSISVDGAR